MRRSPPNYIANFDSASAMLRAVARYLRGQDFPTLGLWPKPMVPALRSLGAVINAAPQAVRESIYIWSGWGEAIAPRKLGSVDIERVAAWAVSEYPRRPYPAAVVGSSGGALVHLCTALGIPFLPQTILIPVARHGVDPDEPKQDLEFGCEVAEPLLEANPDLILHHMNDANQDRLMIHRMTYFRVKRMRLGPSYERFLRETLEPGATLFVSECTLSWPTIRIGDRHVFQHGALGGATVEEFHQGSPRVEKYLERYDSHVRRWDSPGGEQESPEAEWGFEPSLLDDVERFAGEHGYRVRRIVHPEPETLSPMVADLYRAWYRRRNMPSNRLVGESFIVMEPWWVMRTGSVPFWLTFNKEPSAELLETYLDAREPFDEIFLMLFSHGVDSVGLVPIADWRAKILAKARRRGDFLGVDETTYPRDFAAFVNYHVDIKRKIPARYPMPGPLSLRQLDDFLDKHGDDYKDDVQWIDHQPATAARPARAP